MSAATRKALADFLFALCSRLLATPLTWLVSRDKRLWLVIGREHGRFTDNTKYFFTWLHRNASAKCKVVFLSEDKQTVQTLREAGARAVSYPGLRGFRALLRAGTVAMDGVDTFEHGRVSFLRGARIVQIWHGAPLKDIEWVRHERRLRAASPPLRAAIRFQKWVLARYAPVDVLVSTSSFFTEHAFRLCFRADSIVESGYPRNDVLFEHDEYPDELVSINVDKQARERLTAHRRNGGKVVLYAPTFRGDPNSPFAAYTIDLPGISRLATAHNALIALKMHPYMHRLYSPDAHSGIINIAADSDVYPLLPEVDVLATDYSSIYFDFLMLDRPIVFYPYDYEHYVTCDHSLLFDYDEMTPGPKARDSETFVSVLLEALSGPDEWKAQRARVRQLVFDHADGHASRRLWQALGNQS